MQQHLLSLHRSLSLSISCFLRLSLSLSLLMKTFLLRRRRIVIFCVIAPAARTLLTYLFYLLENENSMQ